MKKLTAGGLQVQRERNGAEVYSSLAVTHSVPVQHVQVAVSRTHQQILLQRLKTDRETEEQYHK